MAGILLVIIMAINGLMLQDVFLNGTNEKYQVSQKLSMSEEELREVVHAMIGYAKGQADSPQLVVEIKGEATEFFNPKEGGHLADVRQLVNKLKVLTVGLLILLLAGEGYLFWKKDYRSMLLGIFFAWGILLLLVAFVGILAFVDIDLVVSGFHKLCFSNENWVLNPAQDRSVWMFRTNMYVDVLLMLGEIVLATAAVTIGGGALALKKGWVKKTK